MTNTQDTEKGGGEGLPEPVPTLSESPTESEPQAEAPPLWDDEDVIANADGLPVFRGQPEGFGLGQDGKFRLQLCTPLPFGKEEVIEKLVFREPRGRDLADFPLDVEKMTMGHLLKFAAKISGKSDSMIGSLSGKDVLRVITVASGFFAGAPEEIGKTA